MLLALGQLSTFVGRTFALWTILFAALGFFLPDVFTSFVPWIVPLLGIIMFGMGLTISFDDLKEVARRPFDVALAVVLQFVIMPLTALVLTLIIPMSPEVAAGVILVGCCPGGTSSNVMTYLAKGDVALSVACTSVSTLLAPILTPLLVYLLASQYLPVDAGAMFVSILKIVLVPVVLGIVCQRYFGTAVRAAISVLPLVSVAGIVLIVAAVVAVNQERIATSGLAILMIVALHNLAGLVLGYAAARAFRLPARKAKTVSLEVGLQNSGLGAALATAHFSPLAAVPSAIFSVWHNISGAIAANLFARMGSDERPRRRAT
ncbi:bile acid:sodium symporter family protein [Fulvimarina sp. 2208YS6-2-32]|uniref:Bile acid:sodium symporter family protein n=1 Tax=Fulvimarina uroteuthidis TaxID=3098149 RepID=A0ABU5I5Q4_9HYPH|nr:bile acid:sodium symporter family protein [Fulvimarina sp. 2208YS6-2-32]MDY8110728.1 bile acid:sodium symporter family protein [Fulvimarina sp. 2208YS6-2-32]